MSFWFYLTTDLRLLCSLLTCYEEGGGENGECTLRKKNEKLYLQLDYSCNGGGPRSLCNLLRCKCTHQPNNHWLYKHTKTHSNDE